MDVGRVPYTVRARLYPDSDREFDLVWYQCRDDAPPLPFPSAINTLYQEGDREDWLETAVGEVFGTAATDHTIARKQFALGTHQCGTADDFAGDGTIDLDAPFVEYRGDGLPKCCGDVRFEPALGGVQFFKWDTGGFQLGGSCPVEVYDLTSARGGVQLGGSAAIVAYLPYPSAGGVQLGGSAAIVAYLPYPSAGGAEVGGACGAVVVFAGGALGGAEVGGEFGVVLDVVAAAGGGAEVGGSAGSTFRVPVAAAGGGQLGGAAGFRARLPVAAAGGGQLGGAAGFLARLPVAAAGGGAIGGAAGFAVRFALPAAGGEQLGGAAGVVYNPGQPTPGTTCAAAPTVNQSQTYTYSITGFATVNWFSWVVPSTGTWHIATTGMSPPSGATLTLFSGGACPNPNFATTTTVGPPRWVWNGVAGDVIRIRINAPFSGTAIYTFVWDSGA